jgi:hypothetical protein
MAQTPLPLKLPCPLSRASQQGVTALHSDEFRQLLAQEGLPASSTTHCELESQQAVSQTWALGQQAFAMQESPVAQQAPPQSAVAHPAPVVVPPVVPPLPFPPVDPVLPPEPPQAAPETTVAKNPTRVRALKVPPEEIDGSAAWRGGA